MSLILDIVTNKQTPCWFCFSSGNILHFKSDVLHQYLDMQSQRSSDQPNLSAIKLDRQQLEALAVFTHALQS